MVAPQSAFARKREATTNAILDATSQIIAERGSDGFTMTEVGQRAKVNRSLIYHYFKDRDNLVTRAIDHVLARYEEAGPDLGIESVERSARIFIEHPEIAQVVFQLLLAGRPLLSLGERVTRTVAALERFKKENAPDATPNPAFGVIVLVFAELSWAFSRHEIAPLLGMSVEEADEQFIDYLRWAAGLGIAMMTERPT